MNVSSPHKAAGQMIKNHRPELVKTLFMQLALRLVALAPIILGYLGEAFKPPFGMAVVIFPVCSVLLYLVLVLPFRFYSRGRLMRYAMGQEPQKGRYSLWLKVALSRFGRAFFWLLPAFVCTAGLYYLWNIADATQLVKVIRFLASLVGGTYLHGTLMLMGLFLLSLVLAYAGWRRHLALEYLPQELLADKPFKTNRQWMRVGSGPLAKTTLKNFIVCLPAVLAVLGILYMDMAPKMTGSMTADLLKGLDTVNKMAFSSNAFTQIAVALAVLYLPFVQYRKAALAAALLDNHGR